MLVSDTVQVTDAGRPLLLPGEVEEALNEKVDLHVLAPGSKTPAQELKGGRAIVTSQRLLWLHSTSPSEASFGIPVGAIAESELRTPATKFWSVHKLRMTVSCDMAGQPVVSAAGGAGGGAGGLLRVDVVLVCKGTMNSFHERLQAAVRRVRAAQASTPSSGPPPHHLAAMQGSAAAGGGGGGVLVAAGPPVGSGPLPPPSSDGGAGAASGPLGSGGAAAAQRVDAALMQQVSRQLQDMGFSEPRSQHAAVAAGTQGLPAAVEWCLAHMDDPLLDLPPTQERYAIPSSSSALMSRHTGGGGAQGGASGQRYAGAGVSGILKREEQRVAETDRSLEEAFRDLSALMAQAQEMVALAQRFRQTTRRQATAGADGSGGEGGSGGGGGGGSAAESPSEADAALERDLVEMGIASPVTKDMAGASYHTELARQLADFLRVPLERSGGMLALPDIYCMFNRARGAELVSPDDLLAAARLLLGLGAPMELHTFPSGVIVVRAAGSGDAQVAERVRRLLAAAEAAAAVAAGAGSGGAARGEAAAAAQEGDVGGEQRQQAGSGGDGGAGPCLTATEVAGAAKVPIGIASEWLLSAEQQGVLCRDEGPDGLRFFRNFFSAGGAAHARATAPAVS